MSLNYILSDGSNPKALMILAHGAGAGMNHSFMEELTKELNQNGISVLRFNFPYMESGRKSPGSPKTNINAWNEALNYALQLNNNLPILLSGKSYGGRMASHLLAEEHFERVKAIIYYGFPLHAPGRDSIDRASHLSQISVPQLFLQGSKDKLAIPELITQVANELDDSRLIFLEEADHSFNVPKRSGKTRSDSIRELVKETSKFIGSIL